MGLMKEFCNHKVVFVGNEQLLDAYESDEFVVLIYGQLKHQGQPINAQDLASVLEHDTTRLALSYQQFSGKFAVLLHEVKSAQTIIFNDAMGMQPCYFSSQNGALYFSASLKALKGLDSMTFSVSEQALFNYMYFHCIPSPSTIYKEASKLEPGKGVIFEGQIQNGTVLLYQPQFASTAASSQTLQKTCLDEIEKAVHSNVTENCGAFLSGGLDSSTVAGMLAKKKDPAKTFSIGFEAEGYDETEFAKITANHFGTEHSVLYLTPEEAAEAFVDVAQYFDEPFGNSSAMAGYFCARFAKQNGVDTLLAGDGGDELFAGNERYAKQKKFEVFLRLPSFLQGSLSAIFNNSITTKLPGFKKVASYIRQAQVQLPGRLQSYNFVNIVGLDNMFTPEFLAKVDTNQPVEQLNQRYAESAGSDPIDNMLYLDWKFTLADNDLIKVNRMCEMAGVDVRYPLLEKSVVDFSCQVPAELKLPGQKLRDFYKQTCRGFLADSTLDKEKHGFGLPFGAWLKENAKLEKLALEALEKFKQRGIVSNSLIDQAIEAHKSVHAGYYGELIWIMVVLELWLQQEA
ncbi:asparagine synthase-related protein [Aliiglaciecola sp.]|nr:asparagine synthase-related protein [Aliiglaciecola sp.]